MIELILGIAAIYFLIIQEYMLFLITAIVYVVYMNIKPQKQAKTAPNVKYVQTAPEITVYDSIPKPPETVAFSTESWGKEPGNAWYAMGSKAVKIITSAIKSLLKVGTEDKKG